MVKTDENSEELIKMKINMDKIDANLASVNSTMTRTQRTLHLFLNRMTQTYICNVTFSYAFRCIFNII